MRSKRAHAEHGGQPAKQKGMKRSCERRNDVDVYDTDTLYVNRALGNKIHSGRSPAKLPTVLFRKRKKKEKTLEDRSPQDAARLDGRKESRGKVLQRETRKPVALVVGLAGP